VSPRFAYLGAGAAAAELAGYGGVRTAGSKVTLFKSWEVALEIQVLRCGESFRQVRLLPRDADREAQRRSFAYGNTHIENERITRATIDQAAEALAKVDRSSPKERP
jgi:hypothetical protein